MRPSSSLRAEMNSCRFLSSSACISASLIMRSMSSLLMSPARSMWMDCSLPVPMSLAETCRMPLASMSKVTSICGTPRGAEGMPTRSKRPRDLLSPAMGRSPCSTWMVTAVWLSAAVENTWLFFVGMVVLRWMSGVITLPRVSMPRVSGVTSSSSTSLTFSSPERMAPWMAAPMATTSSGLRLRFGFLPKNFSTASCTAGMRVLPPTSSTS